MERVFADHLSTESVVLLGSGGQVSDTSSHPQSGVGVTPRPSHHPLSPSYTPVASEPRPLPTHAHRHVPLTTGSGSPHHRKPVVVGTSPTPPHHHQSNVSPTQQHSRRVHSSPVHPHTLPPAPASVPALLRGKTHHSSILSTPLLSLPHTLVSQSSGQSVRYPGLCTVEPQYNRI